MRTDAHGEIGVASENSSEANAARLIAGPGCSDVTRRAYSTPKRNRLRSEIDLPNHFRFAGRLGLHRNRMSKNGEGADRAEKRQAQKYPLRPPFHARELCSTN